MFSLTYAHRGSEHVHRDLHQPEISNRYLWRRKNLYAQRIKRNQVADTPDIPLTEISPILDRTNGSLDKSQYGLFVKFFRQASPYIEGHRGRSFVIAIPGEVLDRKDILDTLLQDVALLHGLGVRVVVVIGARMQINEAIRAKGSEPRYVKGYRVTDDVAMKAAVAAAGAARMVVEARLSKAPTVTMMRRHARGNEMGSSSPRNQTPSVTTVSGNYVAAKRKGVVGGIDYQHTGSVRFIQSEAVQYQLQNGNVVLLSNLGYSASGEPLNCDIYSVAVRAAIDLNADKLIIVAPPGGDESLRDLPAWLPIQDAEKLLLSISRSTCSSENEDSPESVSNQQTGEDLKDGQRSDDEAFRKAADELDFDSWYELGLPMPLLAACMVCREGVKRAHIIDAGMDGALLLELYSTDGVGYMISSDFYEGLRAANLSDVPRIYDLLEPAMNKGILVKRSVEQLSDDLMYFTVLERESQLLACASVRPLGKNDLDENVAELGAFCVHPEYRGGGKGDTLLEFVEDKASAAGIDRLVLLTTRTADWFQQRGFEPAGVAHSSNLLPASRRKVIDSTRNSQLYFKILRASS
jgi:amino-acid N-acetyltransferase